MEDADKIIVLEDGEMLDIGTHEELLKRCEIYKEIHYSQIPEEPEKKNTSAEEAE